MEETAAGGFVAPALLLNRTRPFSFLMAAAVVGLGGTFPRVSG